MTDVQQQLDAFVRKEEAIPVKSWHAECKLFALYHQTGVLRRTLEYRANMEDASAAKPGKEKASLTKLRKDIKRMQEDIVSQQATLVGSVKYRDWSFQPLLDHNLESKRSSSFLASLLAHGAAKAKAEMKQFGELVYTVKKPSRIAASADFVALAVDKIEANVVELKFPKDKGSVLWLVTEILQAEEIFLSASTTASLDLSGGAELPSLPAMSGSLAGTRCSDGSLSYKLRGGGPFTFGARLRGYRFNKDGKHDPTQPWDSAFQKLYKPKMVRSGGGDPEYVEADIDWECVEYEDD